MTAFSTKEERDAWRKLVKAPHWSGPETEAASEAIGRLLDEVDLLRAELRRLGVEIA